MVKNCLETRGSILSYIDTLVSLIAEALGISEVRCVRAENSRAIQHGTDQSFRFNSLSSYLILMKQIRREMVLQPRLQSCLKLGKEGWTSGLSLSDLFILWAWPFQGPIWTPPAVPFPWAMGINSPRFSVALLHASHAQGSRQWNPANGVRVSFPEPP